MLAARAPFGEFGRRDLGRGRGLLSWYSTHETDTGQRRRPFIWRSSGWGKGPDGDLDGWGVVEQGRRGGEREAGGGGEGVFLNFARGAGEGPELVVDVAAEEPAAGVDGVEAVAFGEPAGQGELRGWAGGAVAGAEGGGGLAGMGAVACVVDETCAVVRGHGGVHVGKVEETAGDGDGDGVCGFEGPEVNAGRAPVAGNNAGAQVEFGKAGKAGEGWAEAGADAGHAERDDGDPGVAIAKIEGEGGGDERGDGLGGDGVVGEEQFAPPLGHDPGAAGERGGPVLLARQNRGEAHTSRLIGMTGRETEVKVRIGNFRAFRRRLREAGFRVKHRRVFERNTIFETEPPSLRPGGKILRLRESGGKCAITYKGPAVVGRHKSREEIEFGASDAEAAYELLTRLGYQPQFRYEKYRTEYARAGEPGVITLDETPIGLYAEVEGQEKWIDSITKTLGIADTEYITDSYGALYLKKCEEDGIEPTHMVFG